MVIVMVMVMTMAMMIIVMAVVVVVVVLMVAVVVVLVLVMVLMLTMIVMTMVVVIAGGNGGIAGGGGGDGDDIDIYGIDLSLGTADGVGGSLCGRRVLRAQRLVRYRDRPPQRGLCFPYPLLYAGGVFKKGRPVCPIFVVCRWGEGRQRGFSSSFLTWNAAQGTC